MKEYYIDVCPKCKKELRVRIYRNENSPLFNANDREIKFSCNCCGNYYWASVSDLVLLND